MKYYAIILAITAIGFISCEKAIIEDNKATTNALENFEYLWNQCNEKYIYFDLKGIDWDAVRLKYEARIYEGMTNDSLFVVLEDMLNELNDGHTNLKSYFNISGPNIPLQGKDNYDQRVVLENYILEDQHITFPFEHGFIADKQIGYVRLSEFSSEIEEKSLNYILNRYENTRGMILDLRENGGGSTNNLLLLLSRFVDEKTLVFYSRQKKPGPDHYAFDDPRPTYIEPSEHKKYLKQVMVLTDRGSFSATSFFAMATKAIDNMTLVGDTTGGGLGMPNGGQLPNGWTYRFSMIQGLSLDKKADYENGVPPDIYAEIDWNNRKKDEIIEKAISMLLQ